MQESTIPAVDFSVETSLERGKKCLAEGKFSEAAGLFSLAVIGDPNCVEAYRFRAEAFFHQEEYQKAFDDAGRVLALVPNDESALFRRATVLAMHEHLEEALECLDLLLQLNRNHIEGLLRRYWVYMQLKQQHAADEDLRTLLVVLPDETPIQFLATQYFLQTGRLEAARTLLSSIITREPNHAEALKYRGLVWRHLGAPDMAVSDLSYAIDISGPSAEMLVERAVAFVEMGKRTLTKKAYKHALGDLTQALEEKSQEILKPAVVLNQRALAWTLFADRCWFDKSGYHKALDDYTEAVTKDPDYLDAFYNRAALRWKLGECGTVIEDCGHVLRLRSDHVDALHLRAEAYLKSGENEKAEADFQTIDRLHGILVERQEQEFSENRQACEQLDCSRMCRS